ncbi:MAG TPA: hypothetical protein VGG62_12195 [Terracidiphilus sp.]|jgi:hypothetical protein
MKIGAIYVIYDCPRDFPNQFVCRIFHGDVPERELFAVGDTIDEIHRQLPPGLYPIGRHQSDDRVIAEVWI